MIDSAARVRIVHGFLWCCLVAVGPLQAQTPAPPEPIESMPIHAGPFGLRPSLAITNVGTDSNVFNTAEDPQDDFTATIVPRIVARVRAGRLTFAYGAASDIVYYKTYEDEGSVNGTTDLRVDANLGRLQPYAFAGWTSTKERLNAEIDVRAPRTQHTISGGARLLLASRTALLVNARRFDLQYDQGSEFRGSDLAHNLNSRTNSIEGGVQLTLTPLTTFNLTTTVQEDRFDSEHSRDADSWRVTPSLQFDPTALIRGTVAVGYRHFDALDPQVPDYSGVVAQILSGYTLLERTKFDLDLTRDVQYSYEDLETYYLSTGGRLTVTHRLAGPFEIQGFVGRQSLGYRDAVAQGAARTDTVDLDGAGVGYWLRPLLRVGFNWEQARRHSEIPDRRYDRRRLFASLTYGS
jgi:hypothetical protein